MFEPINKAHAIVEMMIFFELHQSDKNKIESIIASSKRLSELFPEEEHIKGFEVVFPADEREDPSTMPVIGTERRRVKSDGNMEWLLRVTTTSISLHCLDYTRWDKVWEFANSALCELFKDNQDLNFKDIGLKYIDRFKYNGKKQDYDIGKLFDRSTRHLTPSAFTSAIRWHNHSGWYDEKSFNGRDILNQLKIDAGCLAREDSKHPYITIDHTIILRRNQNDNLLGFAVTKDSGSLLSSLMKELHIKNKCVLKQLLTKEVSKRIQLT